MRKHCLSGHLIERFSPKSPVIENSPGIKSQKSQMMDFEIKNRNDRFKKDYAYNRLKK